MTAGCTRASMCMKCVSMYDDPIEGTEQKYQDQDWTRVGVAIANSGNSSSCDSKFLRWQQIPRFSSWKIARVQIFANKTVILLYNLIRLKLLSVDCVRTFFLCHFLSDITIPVVLVSGNIEILSVQTFELRRLRNSSPSLNCTKVHTYASR